MIDYQSTLISEDMCKRFITTLYNHGKLFHFDDDPLVQLDANGWPLFTPKECKHLDERIEEIFNILDDPHELAVELISGQQSNHNR